MRVEKPHQLAGNIEHRVFGSIRGAFGNGFRRFTSHCGIRSRISSPFRSVVSIGAVFAISLIGVLLLMGCVADAQTTDSTSDQSFASDFSENSDTLFNVQTQLFLTYAPILRMHPSEKVIPTAVEVMIENANIKNADGEDVRDYNVPPLEDYKRFVDREDHYFDLATAAPYWLDDRTYSGYDVAADALSYRGHSTPTVYARSVVHQGILVLQYWFFYPLDRNHEGDWEMVQLEFDAGDVSSNSPRQFIDLASNLLRNRIEPTRVIYSSHWLLADAECWGEPDASEVQREGLRAHVFPALGSHANYFEPGEYDIDPRDGERYEVLDHVSAKGIALVPPSFQGIGDDNPPEEMPSGVRKYEIVFLDTKTNEFAWLDFRGKWGEQTGRNNGDGPNGPKFYGVDVPPVLDAFLSERVELWNDASTWWKVLPFGLDALDCRADIELVADRGIQSIGYKEVTINSDLDDPDELTLGFSYPAIDKFFSGLHVEIHRVDRDDSVLNAVPALGTRVNGAELPVGSFVHYYDIEMNQAIDETVTICMRVPVGYDYINFGANIWQYDDDGSEWVELPTEFDRRRGDVLACAETTSFSLFALFGPGIFGPGNQADSEVASELPVTGGGASASNGSVVWMLLTGLSMLVFGCAAVRVGRRITRRTR